MANINEQKLDTLKECKGDTRPTSCN